eukprot:TRINITY_DN15497_c0_g1_i1.p1 TRINITY_DN15497_c0_g1~~TRINITY_DN15497_c0_g1_i1.p1  ORF type:complete len:359 (+),score=39.98 TRINITY_DN15497_c0_g1_i1:23-1078(+)
MASPLGEQLASRLGAIQYDMQAQVDVLSNADYTVLADRLHEMLRLAEQFCVKTADSSTLLQRSGSISAANGNPSATTVALLRSTSGQPPPTHTSKNRTQDGLLSRQLDQGKFTFLPEQYHPEKKLVEWLNSVPLRKAEGYIVCPECSGITSDPLRTHYEKHHFRLLASLPNSFFDNFAEKAHHPTCRDIVHKVLQHGEASELTLAEYLASLPEKVELGEDARHAIAAYTLETELYGTANAAMRHNDAAGIVMYRDFIAHLVNGLLVLPPYIGPTYRALDQVVDGLVMYEPGSVITWQAFSSSTMSPMVVADFLGNRGQGESELEVVAISHLCLFFQRNRRLPSYPTHNFER